MGWWWLWIALILIGTAMLAVLVSKLHVKFYLSRQEQNDDLYVQIRALYGLIDRKVKVPQVKFKGLDKGWDVQTEQVNENDPARAQADKQKVTMERIQRWYDNLELFLKQVTEYFSWLKATLAKFRCVSFEWSTHIGLGDAPETAMAVGGVWAVQSSISGFVFRYLPLAEGTLPRMAVYPQYNRLMFATNLVYEADVRLGPLLISLLQLLWRMRKFRKKPASGSGSLSEA